MRRILDSGLTLVLVCLCRSVGIAGHGGLVGAAGGQHVIHHCWTELSGLHSVLAGWHTFNSEQQERWEREILSLKYRHGFTKCFTARSSSINVFNDLLHNWIGEESENFTNTLPILISDLHNFIQNTFWIYKLRGASQNIYIYIFLILYIKIIRGACVIATEEHTASVSERDRAHLSI